MDRRLKERLYPGDYYLRLWQEVVLGQGGVRMLKALGHSKRLCFNMNEKHTAHLGNELLYREINALGRAEIDEEILHNVRAKCVFKTLTHIPTKHDQIEIELVQKMLGHDTTFLNRREFFQFEGS